MKQKRARADRAASATGPDAGRIASARERLLRLFARRGGRQGQRRQKPESAGSGALQSDLERAFEEQRINETTDLARQACIMALALTTTFAVLDVWAIPSALLEVWGIRVAMVAVSLGVFLLTDRESFIRRYEPIMMGMFLVLGFGVEGMVMLAERGEAARSVYFSGVLLVLMGLLTFSHLRSGATVLCALALLSGYLGITLGPHQADTSGELPVVLANCAFFGAVWCVGWIARGLRERHARESFVRKRKLEAEVAYKERARQVSEHLSNHDSLTGLPNRKNFERRLDAMIQSASLEGQLVAVLFIDLDGFKAVNDRCGHQAGDHVLRSVASRLRRGVARDDVVARLSGDEFVVAAGLPPERRDFARTLADRMEVHVREPIGVGKLAVKIGASVGVAIFPGDGENTTALLAAADADMYRIKRTHKAAERERRAIAEKG